MKRYECAILQNKLKGTPVIPLLVAEAEKNNNSDNNNSEFIFKPFNFNDLHPSLFPSAPHSRGRDVQKIIDDMRYK